MREIDILNFLLGLSPELKTTYELYQNLLLTLQTRNLNRFKHILDTESPLIALNFKPLFKPLNRINHILKISSSLYTNGPIKGINNKIKLINGIAFGYSSFYEFKSRNLITQDLTKPKVKS